MSMVGGVAMFPGMSKLRYPVSLALVLVSCSPEPPAGPPPAASSPPVEQPAGPPLDPGQRGGPQAGPGGAPQQGQGDPLLIPADIEDWRFDAGGFVPSFEWYGEGSWDDVRMRAVGHISAAGRDLARSAAQRGDLPAAAGHYRALEAILAAVPVQPGHEHAASSLAALRAAARRDAALCETLAAGDPPAVEGEGLAALRARVLGLALQPPGPGRRAAALELQAALEPWLEHRDDLDLWAFRDFHARHTLRVRLLDAYLDSLDPLGLEERWGFWDASELQRQALALGLTAAALGGDDWSARAEAWLPTGAPALAGPATTWPSVLAGALRAPDQAPRFTVQGLGLLPTGDSLVDVAGWPGPAPIGSLAKLGLDDAEHRPWLEDKAAAFNLALGSDPSAIPALVAVAAGELDAYGHGSRYYNIKQLRNEAVRQLARAGEPALALEVLRSHWPLHHQDWACPNREGILSAIEGRLLAEAGLEPTALQRSVDQGQAFLVLVSQAEAAGPGAGPGRMPPRPKPPEGNRGPVPTGPPPPR